MSDPAASRRLTLHCVGDVILDEPEPDSFFEPARARLAAADVVVAHVEVPHTQRGHEESVDVPAPPAAPEHLAALRAAGVNVATLAGNHIADQGTEGVLDTVQQLRELGIATAGAGADLSSARAAAVVEAGGVSVGVLSRNCVGPRQSWATSGKAGCAYVNVLTHYEISYASPGSPPSRTYTFADPDDLQALERDVRELRARVDVLAVALHQGIGHTPVVLADYERAVARAVVDAGADIVVGHHAHIMRGIDFHCGRPIFHGLGNFVTVTRALTPAGVSAERSEWARRRRELYGFAPDPAMPTYPFHPESRNTIIARLQWRGDDPAQASFVPCYIDERARPCPLRAQEGGREVAEYVERISRAAGMATQFSWRGDEVVVEPGGGEAHAR